jgi:N-acetylglucosaminyldiphosphoundecaprenol N-acetyl-beta-D-mannosaminyltransferase
VTPNAGHLKNVLKDRLLNGIYSKADLCLIDGWPIAVAASIVNKQKVPRITGSDLIPELLKKLNKDIRVGIIGGKDQIKIRQTLESIYPNLNIQVIDTTNWSDSIYDIRRLRELVQHNALSIVLLCLGHPKQEILAQELKNYDWVGARPDWIMCIGSSIDYLIGDQNRSPKFFSKLGLEWFYRLILNPKKFLKRYASAIYPSLKLITKSIQLRIFN